MFISVFAEEKIILQLKWEHQFQFAGYYAAKEQGYYQDAGIDLEIREQNLHNPVDITDEVVSHKAYYGVNSSSLLADISNNKPIILLSAMFEHSPLVLICRKEAKIRSVQDLQDKKIMFAKEEGNSLQLSSMLKNEGVNYTTLQYDFDAFLKGEGDAFTGYLGNEPYRLKKQKLEYTVIDPANYGVDSYSDFLFTSMQEYKQHPERVQNFVMASIKGWQYALTHEDEIAKLIHEKYQPSRSVEALTFEATMIKRHAIYDIKKIGRIELDKLSHMLLMMKEAKLLKTNVDITKHICPRQLSQIELTPDERRWLSTHPVVTYSSVHWLPMEVAGSRKEIVERYLNLITLKSGLHFKYVQKEPYAYAFQELERGVLDLYVGTQEKEGTLASTTIRSFPLVIVTRNDEDYIASTDTLNIKTIALVKGSFSSRYIEKNYPEIKKIYVKDIKEGLELVAGSDAFATVEILPLITLYIKALHMANIKISGEFPYKYRLKAIAKADSIELISILDKAIAAISVDEHNMINDKWKIAEVQKQRDYTLILSGILIASLLVSILIYSNWRLRSEVSRREALQTELKRMFDVVNQNVYLSMTDKEGNITYVSDAFCRFTGYTREQLIGQNHRLLKDPRTPESFYKNMWDIISSGRVYRGEIENRTRSGQMYWVDASITPIYSDDGEIETYMAIRKDITSEKRVAKLAITDALSDLYNRRYFNMVFEKEINRLKREHGALCFIMLDIDHFKLYNDKYGHLKGDEVITAVANSLKDVCKRSTDQVFRLGGEEFGIVLINPKVEKVEAFTAKVINSIENLHIKHEENDPFSWVTASLGAVVCTLEKDSNLDAKDIYQIADEAMYTSKQTGRNRATISRV